MITSTLSSNAEAGSQDERAGPPGAGGLHDWRALFEDAAGAFLAASRNCKNSVECEQAFLESMGPLLRRYVSVTSEAPKGSSAKARHAGDSGQRA